MLKGRESMGTQSNQEAFEEERQRVKDIIKSEQESECGDPDCLSCRVTRLGWMTKSGVVDPDHEDDVINALSVATVFMNSAAMSMSLSLADGFTFLIESPSERFRRIRAARELDLTAATLFHAAEYYALIRTERDDLLSPLSAEGVMEGIQDYLRQERNEDDRGRGHGESRGD